MHKIETPYVTMLQTIIRNKETEAKELQETLLKLGMFMSSEIIGKEFLQTDVVITPLNENFQGLNLVRSQTIIISTKDDYEYFAKGISMNFNNCLIGYMDFAGIKGPEALNSPIRSYSLPEIKSGSIVDTIIIAKSVLATGCTAITLLKKSIERYKPKNVIVTSVFYSNQGIYEIMTEVQNCKIYVCGNADSLNKEGMLIPGVGNLDQRLKVIGM